MPLRLSDLPHQLRAQAAALIGKTKGNGKPGNTDKAEIFAALWKYEAAVFESPEREYRFHPRRKWRFDFAFVAKRVAVEVDGGQWVKNGGRHNTDADREKLNTAAAMGWRVLRFSPRMLKQAPDDCVRQVIEALDYASR